MLSAVYCHAVWGYRGQSPGRSPLICTFSPQTSPTPTMLYHPPVNGLPRHIEHLSKLPLRTMNLVNVRETFISCNDNTLFELVGVLLVCLLKLQLPHFNWSTFGLCNVIVEIAHEFDLGSLHNLCIELCGIVLWHRSFAVLIYL